MACATPKDVVIYRLIYGIYFYGDARPTVTFPVAGYRCPATGTKSYCLVTEAHVREQLA